MHKVLFCIVLEIIHMYVFNHTGILQGCLTATEIIVSFDFNEICFQISHQEHASIGSDNGLAPNRRQAITWTNGGIVFWRIYMYQPASVS